MLLFLLLYRCFYHKSEGRKYKNSPKMNLDKKKLITQKENQTSLPINNSNNNKNNTVPTNKEKEQFQQELWNLPGFQSLLRPFAGKVSADEFNVWNMLYPTTDNSNFSLNNSYFFLDLRFSSDEISNLEAFVKGMLLYLSENIGPCSIDAFLRDKKGDYHHYLQYSGNLFFSEKNRKIGNDSYWKRVIKDVESKNYVVVKQKKEWIFPIPSRFGPLGFLHICCEEALSMDNNEHDILKKLWYIIRKYGETLLQICIYEQSVVDTESGFFNGIRFQEDLRREMASKLENNNPNNLLLIELSGELTQLAISSSARQLRQLLPYPIRIYRIGQNILSIFINESLSKWGPQLAAFKEYTHNNHNIEVSYGSALLDDKIDYPQEWFVQAQNALGASEYPSYNSNSELFERAS